MSIQGAEICTRIPVIKGCGILHQNFSYELGTKMSIRGCRILHLILLKGVEFCTKYVSGELVYERICTSSTFVYSPKYMHLMQCFYINLSVTSF